MMKASEMGHATMVEPALDAKADTYPRCGPEQACGVHSDCLSSKCNTNKKCAPMSVAPTLAPTLVPSSTPTAIPTVRPTHGSCTDGLFSPDIGETDVDCGGRYCHPCGVGSDCDADTDCHSSKCKANNKCAPSTASPTFSPTLIPTSHPTHGACETCPRLGWFPMH